MASNGHVIPGTSIAVDLWNTKLFPQARIFFLSHFHSDHTVGLTKSWKYPIYTSPITSRLLMRRIGVDPSLVRILELNEDHLIPLDEKGFETITVTLFDANHCPGSTMFLFSGYFGDILYTGDFRHHSEIFSDFELPDIDVLYIDNTYCSPKCVFPKREDAVEQILQQIHICLVKGKRVFLGLDNLGKEDLLQKIAKERQCKICMNPARKEIFDALGLSHIVTTNKSESCIFVVPTNQINTRNITKWNEEMETHAILATARYCGFNFKPYANSKNIHVIPYSNHSCYSELVEFVKLVHPRSIKPIVGKHAKGMFGIKIADRADMSVFESFLDDSAQTEISIPYCVQKILDSVSADPKPTGKSELEFELMSAESSSKQLRPNHAFDVEYSQTDTCDSPLNHKRSNSSHSTNNEMVNFASSSRKKPCTSMEKDISDTSSDEDSNSTNTIDNLPNSTQTSKPDNVWQIIHLSGNDTAQVFLDK